MKNILNTANIHKNISKFLFKEDDFLDDKYYVLISGVVQIKRNK